MLLHRLNYYRVSKCPSQLVHIKEKRTVASPTSKSNRVVSVTRHLNTHRVCCRSSGDTGSSNNHQNMEQHDRPSHSSKIKTFLLSNFLFLALLSALILGVAAPQLGAAASKTQLQTLVVIAIFIASGLQIKKGEALEALHATGSVSYGLLSILILSPLLAPLVMSFPLHPPALSLGLAVFLCSPTSLSTGIAMTQSLGGNVAMAILLTVSSSLLSIFTIPFLLPHLLGLSAGGLNLDSVGLLKQLLQIVLLPTLFGALVRARVPGAESAIDRNRKGLTCFSAFCLAIVPWMQVSKTIASQGSVGLSITSLAASAACGVTIHLFLLLANSIMVKILRLGGNDPVQALKIQQAVVLLSSQKTLPVTLTVLTKLSVTFGEAVGLAAITAVFSHLSQILVDSFLVSWWLKTRGRIGEPPTVKASID